MLKRDKLKNADSPFGSAQQLMIERIQAGNGSAALGWLIRTSPLMITDSTTVIRGLARRRVVKVCDRSLDIVDKMARRHQKAGKTPRQTKRLVGKELVILSVQEKAADRTRGPVPVARAVVRLTL